MKTPRKEVYRVIDGERRYQDNKWRDLDERNAVADFLLYIRQQLDEALDLHNADHPQLDQVRKIAALAVACMERHGAPGRER